MSKRKKTIRYAKERVVLSDTLPFETPVIFSNRHYYRFLTENKVEFAGNKLLTKTDLKGGMKEGFNQIIELLFSENLESPNDRTIPFSYRINHKEKSFRELALIHPINQIKMVQFYDEYKDLILYYCSKSNFSIRRPASVAKFTFFNDKLHQSLKGASDDFLELDGKEYENLKTYFTYKEYPNIYRFYEHHRFHRSEKKFKYLKSFDISKCFDSIYTHSIAWAVLGLDSVKENITPSNKTFAGKFDKLLQYSNYGETNGIVIGPEFSRIFAEIILQQIDFQIDNELRKRKLISGTDYEIFRYVDDYFLFCDDDRLKEEVLVMFNHALKPYKLGVNEQKTNDYQKPIITEITIAKDKINKLFDKVPRIAIEELDSPNSGNDNGFVFNEFNLFFSSTSIKTITDYKIIIKESGVDYRDVLNYSLSILNRKIEQALTSFEKFYREQGVFKGTESISQWELKKKLDIENQLVTFIENFLDFAFFIYSVSPRVNSTIKICHILSKIISFSKERVRVTMAEDVFEYHTIISNNSKDRIFKRIYDESSAILKKNAPNKYSKLESLYLLTIMSDLGKSYRLSENILYEYFGIAVNDSGTREIESGFLNYFSITILLFYIKNSTRYSDLKGKLEHYIIEYIKSVSVEKRQRSSEIVHLVADLMFCPYISLRFKKIVLASYKNVGGISEMRKISADVNNIILFKRQQRYMFTKWEHVDLTKEFENKKSMEVYS